MIKKYRVDGMSCAACSAAVERAVAKLDGVSEIQVNLLGKSLICDVAEGGASDKDIISAINKIGFKASIFKPESKETNTGKKSIFTEKLRLLVSVPLLLLLMYVAMAPMLSIPYPSFLAGAENAYLRASIQLALTIPILIVNFKFYRNGFSSVFKLHPNMDSLVAVSSAAAFIFSVAQTVFVFISLNDGNISAALDYSHNLYYDSAAMILTLVTVGKALEERAKNHTGDAIAKLVDLTPKTAICIKDGKETEILTENIAVGDILIVYPGGRIPTDGIVVEGISAVDESAITGESMPSEKLVGSEVLGGTINGTGVFKMRATKVGEDTVVSQIAQMVENAAATKAPIARLADKIAGVFVPVVIAISVVTFMIWLIAGEGLAFALANGISVLVISCPCALGLATPVAVTVAAGKFAEKGILIKSAAVLEMLHKIDTVVLDKTGTITNGKPWVSAVYPADISREELLKTACSLEKNSEHPLAEAIEGAYGGETYETEDFQVLAGLGLQAKIAGEIVCGGNRRYMEQLGIDVSSAPNDRGTAMFFARNNKFLGVIYAADEIKESSIAAVDALKARGIDIVMLSGDSKENAESVKQRLGLKEAVGEVLPNDKAEYIKSLKQKGRRVAMVGDGINDSPALALADIGIAIGSGTDIAIDSADIILTNSNLNDVPVALSLGSKTMRIIKQNLFWAFIYNILCIPVAAGVLYPIFGIVLSPMIGAACMCMSSLIVNLNALRIKRY